MRLSFQHKQDPHIEERKRSGPAKLKRHGSSFNEKLAIALTRGVGTMWCAYAFAALALIALPDALHSGVLGFVQWVSQTFIQLVMLSVIMVGQNILGQAADRRAELTYKDAEAAFHEAQQIQAHLKEQDDALNSILERLEKLAASRDV